MSVVAGSRCPHCGYEGSDEVPIELLKMHNDLENRYPVAMDLRCGVCFFEWREFLE